MDEKNKLCNCVESLREIADQTSSEEMRSTIMALTDKLVQVSEPECGERLTPDLKCIYDQAERCNENPDSQSCNRFYAHANRILSACESGSCC